jgi:LysR family hydrogen peroxide-inducible transcriptional activator
MVRTVQSAGEPFTGVFRLGAIPTIAPFLLPRALPLLKHKFPKLRLQMREDLTTRLIEALRARTLDAALIALPYEAHGVATASIADDEFLFLCPETHPLARRNDLSPDQMKSEDMLLLEDGHCLREHALSACRIAPGRRSSEVGATSLHTLVQMVAGGMGVTLLPKIAAEGGAIAGAHVSVRPFSTPLIGRSIGIAWREGGPREDEARKLAEVLRELF